MAANLNHNSPVYIPSFNLQLNVMFIAICETLKTLNNLADAIPAFGGGVTETLGDD